MDASTLVIDEFVVYDGIAKIPGGGIISPGTQGYTISHVAFAKAIGNSNVCCCLSRIGLDVDSALGHVTMRILECTAVYDDAVGGRDSQSKPAVAVCG